MFKSVRPQIYATMPVAEVEEELRRGKLPALFIRRMRVINILSAVTLRKIEDDLIAPFGVMDIHHILDKQISQDTIIAAMHSDHLATAIKTGNLEPLRSIADKNPLLKKGFAQGWIQLFIEKPFDPICVILALRAKLMFEVIDELGHSYNLLRSMGLGWIAFGDIPGETPGDPGSYVPPVVDTPIDGFVPPAPPADGDGDAIGNGNGNGDGEALPPAPAPPAPPALPLPPAPPAPPCPIPPGAGGGPTGDAPWGLSFIPGITGLPAMTGPWFPGGRRNCCMDKDDQEVFVHIGYSAASVNAGGTVELTVEGAHEECGGTYYAWSEVNSCGSIDTELGLSATYTAPATKAECPENAKIQLSCGGEVVGELEITILCDCEDAAIGYTTNQMSVDEEQTLSVANPTEGCTYVWEITAGGGSLSAGSGLEVVYTAPSTNPYCENNPTIRLSTGGNICDVLSLAINAIEVGGAAYEERGGCVSQGHGTFCGVHCPNPNCVYCCGYDHYCDGSIIAGTGSTSGCTSGQPGYWTVGNCAACADPASCNLLTDTRTTEMKAQGCCPAALL